MFLMTWLDATSSQDSLIQVHTSEMSGFPIDLEGVKVCLIESISQSVHFIRTFCLIGLLILTSMGWSWDVRPPRVTQVSVCSFCCVVQLAGTCCTLKESEVSKLRFLSRPPGLLHHTLPIHTFMPSWSIHHCGWTLSTISRGMTSFGILFLLNITLDFSSLPFAKQARTTVKWFFSCPEVLHGWLFLPLYSSSIWRHVRLRSCLTLVSNLLQGIIFCLSCLDHSSWKVWILSCNWSGNVCPSRVFWHKTRSWQHMKRHSKVELPLISWRSVSFANN